MKLVRYGETGAERPGMIDPTGVLRDLSGHVTDIDANMLGDEALARLRALDPSALPAVTGSPQQIDESIDKDKTYISWDCLLLSC